MFAWRFWRRSFWRRAGAVGGFVLAVLVLLLSQWAANVFVPVEQRARRDQRYRRLLRVPRRLVDLSCALLYVIWTVMGIPVLRDLSSNAVLASGAVLGALAIVFQGLLRDFVAGLVRVNALVVTEAGCQEEVRRELLGRLVQLPCFTHSLKSQGNIKS